MLRRFGTSIGYCCSLARSLFEVLEDLWLYEKLNIQEPAASTTTAPKL